MGSDNCKDPSKSSKQSPLRMQPMLTSRQILQKQKQRVQMRNRRSQIYSDGGARPNVSAQCKTRPPTHTPNRLRQANEDKTGLCKWYAQRAKHNRYVTAPKPDPPEQNQPGRYQKYAIQKKTAFAEQPPL